MIPSHKVLVENAKLDTGIVTFSNAISDTNGENRSTGDNFFELLQPVDAIKIDVEGTELKVLKGFAKTIEKDHPIIFLELHRDMMWWENDTEEILSMIEKWNYKIFDSRTDSEISIDDILKEKTTQLRLILL